MVRIRTINGRKVPLPGFDHIEPSNHENRKGTTSSLLDEEHIRRIQAKFTQQIKEKFKVKHVWLF